MLLFLIFNCDFCVWLFLLLTLSVEPYYADRSSSSLTQKHLLTLLL